MAVGNANCTIYSGPTTTLSQTFRSSDGTTSGNLSPMVYLRDDAGNIIGASSALPVYIATDPIAIVSANFNRPADTNAYASGDLVANSVTAGSVTPMTFAGVVRTTAGSAKIRRARVRKTGTGVTNASFRLHLYGTLPTVTNGDNAAWLSVRAAYLGSIDVTVDKAFSDGAEGSGTNQSGTGSEIAFVAVATSIYGLLEARGAYTPESGETITVELECEQH